jgi:hypothetical protein
MPKRTGSNQEQVVYQTGQASVTVDVVAV